MKTEISPSARPLLLALLPLTLATALLLVADRGSLAAPEPLVAAVAAVPSGEPVPRLLSELPPPPIEARAFLSAYLSPLGQLTVLAERDAKLRWPIASITKLFTASVATEQDSLDRVITLGNDDLPEIADSGFFSSGESFRLADLFLPLLLESSNNAAVILANHSRPDRPDRDSFIQDLNQLANKLTLRDTRFFNPSGLDSPAGVNYSSSYDLALFAKWLLHDRAELLALTRLPAAILTQANGEFHHQINSTNELLLSAPWSGEIIGGKTGSTDLAGKNLLLILRAPNQVGYLISVVLGAHDHFATTRALIDWTLASYQFTS